MSSYELGCETGSMCVVIVTWPSSSRIRPSISSDKSCACTTVQWSGTSMWKLMKLRAAARRVRKAWNWTENAGRKTGGFFKELFK